MIIIITAIFALILAFVLGFALGFFKKIFAVAVDPLAGQVRDCLPGANCGGCGFAGCDGYAAAVAAKTAGINKCPVGGQAVAEKLAALMGGSASMAPEIAILACQGSKDLAPLKGEYSGMRTCRGAKLAVGGTKLCAWGCMGFGDCVNVCQFGALALGRDGLPVIDRDACTGCKACMSACPQGLIRIAPKNRRGSMALCSNRNPLKPQVRKTCKTGCIKCALCVRTCLDHCITIIDGIPVVDYAKCSACAACVAKCPSHVLKLLG
ncbi:MAG: RnfABCDGE type electron transport complex subunit B [Treponema sp.]|nr:RnfABCDGE type electron transport complex subunit B [Treponema sp.]